jgi:MerR family transcriptional regulator, copper efflux regulator
VDGFTIGHAAQSTGWSPRMLRYLEQRALVVPRRSPAGYRLYGLRELTRLLTLRQLKIRFGVELADLAFAARLRREPELRRAVDGWLAGSDERVGDWVDWEQRKHERLLAA